MANQTSGSLRSSAVQGVTWFGISYGLGQGLHFVGMIVLARLLFPEDFGIVAMATIVTGLVMQIGDLGFGEAIIQRKEVTNSHLSTAFWAALALGIIFCIVTVAISPLVASFFQNELVRPILVVSALAFVIAPLRSVHGALLRKRLQFFRFSVSEISQGIAFAVVAVPLAFAGLGVWSLVIGTLAGHITLAILRWILCPWHPSLMFSVKSLRDLWRFSMNLTGSRTVQYLSQRLDYLIIGRFLIPAALGFYQLGYRIAAFPTTGLQMSVGRIAFPTFSAAQDKHEQVRHGYLKSLTYLSLFTLPAFIGLAVVAPEFVTVLFGSKWIQAIIPLQILCIMACFGSLNLTLVLPVIRSKGRTDIELKMNLVRIALLVVALLIGVRFGTLGIAIAVSAVAIITWLPLQIIANRLVGLPMKDFLASLRPAALGSVVMLLALLAFRYAAANLLTLSDIGLLISSVLLGASTFFVTLKAARTQALNEIIELVMEMVRSYVKPVFVKMHLFKKQAQSVDNLPYEE